MNKYRDEQVQALESTIAAFRVEDAQRTHELAADLYESASAALNLGPVVAGPVHDTWMKAAALLERSENLLRSARLLAEG